MTIIVTSILVFIILYKSNKKNNINKEENKERKFLKVTKQEDLKSPFFGGGEETDLMLVIQKEVKSHYGSVEKLKSDKDINNIKTKNNMLEKNNNNCIVTYTSTRLTFRRDLIESLKDGERFRIHVVNDNVNETFIFSKEEFYDVFTNVVNSKSYKILGNYNYQNTPQRAYQFLV